MGPFARSTKALSALQGPCWAVLGLGSPHEPWAEVSDAASPKVDVSRKKKKSKDSKKKGNRGSNTQLKATSAAFHEADSRGEARTDPSGFILSPLCQALYMKSSQPEQLLLTPVLLRRKVRSEGLSNLPEITQQVSKEAWIQCTGLPRFHPACASGCGRGRARTRKGLAAGVRARWWPGSLATTMGNFLPLHDSVTLPVKWECSCQPCLK